MTYFNNYIELNNKFIKLYHILNDSLSPHNRYFIFDENFLDHFPFCFLPLLFPLIQSLSSQNFNAFCVLIICKRFCLLRLRLPCLTAYRNSSYPIFPNCRISGRSLLLQTTIEVQKLNSNIDTVITSYVVSHSNVILIF